MFVAGVLPREATRSYCRSCGKIPRNGRSVTKTIVVRVRKGFANPQEDSFLLVVWKTCRRGNSLCPGDLHSGRRVIKRAIVYGRGTDKLQQNVKCWKNLAFARHESAGTRLSCYFYKIMGRGTVVLS